MNSKASESGARPAPSEPVIFSLLHAAHALENRMEKALESVQLSMPKYGVLSQLVEAGEALSLGELAARLACVRSNMTQLVDRLEADGLVRRVDDPADRRSVRAAITGLGEDRQRAGARELETVFADFRATVPKADRAALERVLSGLG
jgi:DNA-binding MarR family transcriptional regulator